MEEDQSSLAERRYKVKYSVNPNGRFWRDDKSGFGRQLIEKMGWKEGSGLGKEGQGRSDPVAVKLKQDRKGVGCSAAAADIFQQHDDFASVLQNLNQVAVEDNTKEKASDNIVEEKIKSLEHKSKHARARLHYHKFTRGKDLSRASASDLRSIFGHKTDSDATVSDTIVSSNQSESLSEKTGIKLVNSGTSIAEYFKKKMSDKISNSSSMDNYSNNDSLQQKKMSSKKEKSINDKKVCYISSDDSDEEKAKDADVIDNDDADNQAQEKKKRKRKTAKVTECVRNKKKLVSDDSAGIEVLEIKNRRQENGYNVDEIEPNKKKEKDNNSSDVVDVPVSIKKRKRRNVDWNVIQDKKKEENSGDAIDVPEVKKRREKHKQVDDEIKQRKKKKQESIPFSNEDTQIQKKKKKLKKKREVKDDETVVAVNDEKVQVFEEIDFSSDDESFQTKKKTDTNNLSHSSSAESDEETPKERKGKSRKVSDNEAEESIFSGSNLLHIGGYNHY